MAKLRILHIVNSLDPGGMENGVVNMIHALQGDFKFKVACLEREGKFAQRLPKPEQVVVVGKQRGFSLQAAIRLRAEIVRYNPDVIHTHNLGPLIYASLATLGGLSKPILHGEHSQLNLDELGKKRMRQRRVLYRCCRKVHTVSHSQREELIGNGFSNISTVVNGVDIARFFPGSKEAGRTQLGIPLDALVMGIVGRFGPFKNHSALLEAFELLAAEVPSLYLLIVGAGGPEEYRVKSQAANLKARGRVAFSGFQPEPRPFYQAMDFLIVPSINEGLSNAVLEAKACGVPVLAHTACGNAEVINSGHEGIVADLANSRSIYHRVREFLTQRSQFSLWSKNSRERAVREFSMDSMAKGYTALYQSIRQRQK